VRCHSSTECGVVCLLAAVRSGVLPVLAEPVARPTLTATMPGARVLESGLVHIPACIDGRAQQLLADVARVAGGDGRSPGTVNGGFFRCNPSTGRREHNHSESWGRGRIFAELERFPRAQELRKLCANVVALARRADPSMPTMTPTHLLLNLYRKGRGIPTHADDAPNDGSGDHPVVSISLGNTCHFMLKHRHDRWKHGFQPTGPCHSVQLAHADAILFGGSCRMIQHAIEGRRIAGRGLVPCWRRGSGPPDCAVLRHLELRAGDGVRINFTFRDAPEVIGHERAYRTFAPGGKAAAAPATAQPRRKHVATAAAPLLPRTKRQRCQGPPPPPPKRRAAASCRPSLPKSNTRCSASKTASMHGQVRRPQAPSPRASAGGGVGCETQKHRCPSVCFCGWRATASGRQAPGGGSRGAHAQGPEEDAGDPGWVGKPVRQQRIRGGGGGGGGGSQLTGVVRHVLEGGQRFRVGVCVRARARACV
jgi:alkylated DNA repair dioxygenase AlkB